MKNFKNITAAALAAVVAAAAPLAGAVNNVLSVTASAYEIEPDDWDFDTILTEGDWEYYVSRDGNSVMINRYRGTDTDVVFPATLGGKNVSTIGRFVIESNDEPLSITISDGIKYICDSAFFHTIKLESVKIPDSVTKIGSGAFSECISLKNIELPNSLTEIENGTFFLCESLKNITIPNGVTEIGFQAFRDCDSLENVTLPASVTKIGFQAFITCPSLKTITYNGTREDWETIEIEVENDGLTNANIIFNTTAESDPATSEPTTSTGVPGDTGTPGSSDKQETIAATLKGVDSKDGLSGAALEKQLFGDSGWTWQQVEKIEFTSDKLFSVQYTAADGSTKTLGEKAEDRAADDGIWNTAWTLDTSLMSKDKPFVKLIAKDGTADITAKVYIKKDAQKPADSDQKSTGIALAIAPVVLAAGAVIVISKKRK